ncbi:hypothetical protein HELRODRAFT_184733 [Helobdella robusta]|uniref:Uncharacterized protein n=1 Tax=Helobdella robusta TaxID=6412 RepID=T1FLW0_HELRO|nr:hypothetical protein HELRODRAFT_184733 [Helobdella robusta]ESO01480.1 hypothetical protein HELRODRAFT_184733 [Helobdella robusta]
MADEQKLAINKSMSAVRISAEHEFAHVGSLWAFLKYSQTQRSGQSPVGLYYIVGTFLKNLHVCYNGGNQTSKKYLCILYSKRACLCSSVLCLVSIARNPLSTFSSNLRIEVSTSPSLIPATILDNSSRKDFNISLASEKSAVD